MSNEEKTVTLTPKQDKFALGVAAGLNQSDAYRMAYSASGMQPKQVWEEASKLRRNPKVAQRIEGLLKAARVQDITNLGREIRLYCARVLRQSTAVFMQPTLRAVAARL